MTDLQFLVPFWGDAELLRLTLQSLVGQSDPRWRALVVDDRAPEGPAARALVAALDPRVEWRENPTNLGITANFQHCLDLSSGSHLVFLGCDDLLRPDYVARLRELIDRHPAVAVVQPGVTVIDGTGAQRLGAADRLKARLRARWPVGAPLGGDALAASLLGGNWLYFPSLCWRADRVRAVGFDLRWHVVEDLDLVLSLLLRGNQLVLDDVEVFAYRRHAASVSSWRADDGSRFVEEARFFAEAADRCEQRGWRRARRAARWHWSSRLHAGLVAAVPVRGRPLEARLAALRHVVGLRR